MSNNKNFEYPAINLQAWLNKEFNFTLILKQTIETQYGEQFMYKGFINEKTPVLLWGCKELNSILDGVDLYDTVNLVYNGKIEKSNYSVHQWNSVYKTQIKTPIQMLEELKTKFKEVDLEKEIKSRIESLSNLIDREGAITLIWKDNFKK